ncbi:MAG: MATE family efflux transporter [Eubacteriales bacterium]|nr:MATE family efflux transporter [Eubacteriales bacterium]
MKRDRKNKRNMIEDAPGRTLFFFALPMILGNLFQQFYNMADSAIVGRFIGEDALAAVGASYALTTVFVMIAIGGGNGSSIITSQYLGAKKYRKMKTSIFTALITFLLVSVVLALFGLGFSGGILRILKTPVNILDQAGIYLKIYFCGLPFLFMYNVLAAMFNATGDSGTPLYLLIFSSVLNVALDILFVTQFALGVAGVAIATVLAQGISAVISFCLLLAKLKGYGEEQESLPEEQEISDTGGGRLFDVSMLGRMIKVAVPTMLQQSIVSVGMLLVQSVVNGFGSSVLAGYTAGSRIDSICIVPMIATGNAVSTFTAQNMGAGRPERVRQGYRAARFMVYGFAVFICVILLLFRYQIIGIFMNGEANTQAYSTGVSYLSFIAFFFVWIGLKATADGVLRGSGDVAVFTAANLVNLAIRVAVANLCAPYWGVAAVWYAVPMGWAANFFISFGRYLSGKWSQKKLIH